MNFIMLPFQMDLKIIKIDISICKYLCQLFFQGFWRIKTSYIIMKCDKKGDNVL